jgi:hypothetical protein
MQAPACYRCGGDRSELYRPLAVVGTLSSTDFPRLAIVRTIAVGRAWMMEFVTSSVAMRAASWAEPASKSHSANAASTSFLATEGLRGSGVSSRDCTSGV